MNEVVILLNDALLTVTQEEKQRDPDWCKPMPLSRPSGTVEVSHPYGSPLAGGEPRLPKHS